jgi:hypothetical protein
MGEPGQDAGAPGAARSGVAVGLSVALVGAQAPAGAAATGAPAAAQGGRGGGGRLGGGGFAAPTKAPSALRAIPAETTAAKAKDPSWKAPRLSWGHPDLEGIWTSDDMLGIRRRARRRRAPANRSRRRSSHGARRRSVARPGRERGDVPPQRIRRSHVRLHLVRRRTGGRPPAGADAGGPRQAEGLVRCRHLRQSPVQRLRGLLALRPLHHPRGRWSVPGAVRQRSSDCPDARRGGHQLRDGARHARHPARPFDRLRVAPSGVEGRRPWSPESGHQAVHGERARALRGRHAGDRDEELHRSDRLPGAQQRRAEAHRVVHAHRPEDDRLPHPPGRPGDVHRAFHDAVHDSEQPNYQMYDTPATRQLGGGQRAQRRARLRAAGGRGQSQGCRFRRATNGPGGGGRAAGPQRSVSADRSLCG